jgi:DNA topoisomerase VI subunit B
MVTPPNSPDLAALLARYTDAARSGPGTAPLSPEAAAMIDRALAELRNAAHTLSPTRDPATDRFSPFIYPH